MSATNAVARDENVRNPLTIAGEASDGKATRPPHRNPNPLAPEIPDIFIPPAPIGNAGVMRGRNENSGMTTGDDGGEGLFHAPGGWEQQKKIEKSDSGAGFLL